MGLFNKTWPGVFHDRGGMWYNAKHPDWGMKLDGTTDDTAALQAVIAEALADRAGIWIPMGTGIIKPIGSAIDFTNVTAVAGVPGSTMLSMHASSTGDGDGRMIVFDNTNPFWNALDSANGLSAIQRITGLIIHGRSVTATGKIGVTVGAYSAAVVAGGVSVRVLMEDCEITRFGSTSSYGLHIRDVVQFYAARTHVRKNYRDVLIEGSGTTTPTTVVFDAACNIREATKCGVLIKQGQGITFRGKTVIEANQEEAVLIQPGTGQVVRQVIMDDCWFEDNWAVHVASPPGTRQAQFAVVADGTSAAIYSVHQVGCFHNDICKTLDANVCIDAFVERPHQASSVAQIDTYKARGASSMHVNGWPVGGADAWAAIDIVPTAYVRLDGALMLEVVGWDPGNVANGAQVTLAVTVPGAVMGDSVEVTSSITLAGLHLCGDMTAADSVLVALTNLTGGGVNLGPMTLRLRVRK